MRGPDWTKVAMALPVRNAAEIIAASQVVIFLLRLLIRAELILHTLPYDAPQPGPYPLGAGAIVFVAAEAAVRGLLLQRLSTFAVVPQIKINRGITLPFDRKLRRVRREFH